MQVVQTVVTWFGTVVTAWAVISTVLNWAFWFKTPEQWVAFAESKPKLAFLVKFCRTVGVDPRKLLVAARDYAAKKAKESGKNSLPQPPEAEEDKKE